MHEAFKLSMRRKQVLHNIHKSNVLKSSVLWNEVQDEPEMSYYEPSHGSAPNIAGQHLLGFLSTPAFCYDVGCDSYRNFSIYAKQCHISNTSRAVDN